LFVIVICECETHEHQLVSMLLYRSQGKKWSTYHDIPRQTTHSRT